MGKTINMGDFDPLLGNLEEYVNKQGCTLGKEAETSALYTVLLYTWSNHRQPMCRCKPEIPKEIPRCTP